MLFSVVCFLYVTDEKQSCDFISLWNPIFSIENNSTEETDVRTYASPKTVEFYINNETKEDFQRQQRSITECLYIPDLPSSHLRICCAHAHFPAAPVARHTSQQTLHLMELLKQAKRILHLSTKFLGPTVGALQMKVTARVRRLITPSTSRHTREWTNLECPLSGSKCSSSIKHTSNLNRLW